MELRDASSKLAGFSLNMVTLLAITLSTGSDLTFIAAGETVAPAVQAAGLRAGAAFAEAYSRAKRAAETCAAGSHGAGASILPAIHSANVTAGLK